MVSSAVLYVNTASSGKRKIFLLSNKEARLASAAWEFCQFVLHNAGSL